MSLQILKNKHVVLAMFITPVLALIAYFATDHVVSEEPHVAEQGQHYKLAAKSDCRYASGHCTLQNGDVKVLVSAERVSDTRIALTLSAGLPIRRAIVAFAAEDGSDDPVLMNADAPDSNVWQAQLGLRDPANSTLRLSVNLLGTVYYAETPAVFVDYETTFSRENFSD